MIPTRYLLTLLIIEAVVFAWGTLLSHYFLDTPSMRYFSFDDAFSAAYNANDFVAINDIMCLMLLLSFSSRGPAKPIRAPVTIPNSTRTTRKMSFNAHCPVSKIF